MARPGLSVSLAALALASAAAAADCPERVVEWVKEPGRTTKTVTVDGVIIYRQTWVKDPDGTSRPVGGTPKPAPRPARARRPAPEPQPASKARSVALSLEGTRYRAGGTDPRTGVNSTGLAVAFLHRMGLEASNEMLALFRLGDFVMKRDVQPGDLVFHHSDGFSRPTPNMVGVALGGGEMVYLSGSRKRVIRTSYTTPWWEARYKGSRRVLGTSAAVPKGRSPKVEPGARTFEGIASYYGCGDGFDGSGTASGERFDASKLTAAHYDLPFQSIVEVTNVANGKKVRVRVNDRGPFERKNGKWVRHSTRVIDLSCRAAEVLGFKSKGLTRVRCRVVD